MITPRRSVLALATAQENAAIRLALARISNAGFEADDSVFDVVAAALSDAAGLCAEFAFASMLPEAEGSGNPWPAAEKRLRTEIAGLRGRVRTLYILTVFRHAPGPDRRATVARIRKLNLLALELSRETGAFVVDVDRMFADAGARSFEVDYRLTSALAGEAVGREIVRTMLATGFDGRLPRPAQERLSAMLEGWRPPRAIMSELTPVARSDPRARNAAVAGGAFSSPGDRAAFVLRRLVRGQIRLREAFDLVERMIRKHGVKSAMTTAWLGARRLLGRPNVS